MAYDPGSTDQSKIKCINWKRMQQNTNPGIFLERWKENIWQQVVVLHRPNTGFTVLVQRGNGFKCNAKLDANSKGQRNKELEWAD